MGSVSSENSQVIFQMVTFFLPCQKCKWIFLDSSYDNLLEFLDLKLIKCEFSSRTSPSQFFTLKPIHTQHPAIGENYHLNELSVYVPRDFCFRCAGLIYVSLYFPVSPDVSVAVCPLTTTSEGSRKSLIFSSGFFFLF